MFGLGTTEIIIIAVVLVLLFGSKKIGDLARGFAEGVKIFRDAFKDPLQDQDDKTGKKNTKV